MNNDLFAYQGEKILRESAPLAERLRPNNLDEFFGQDEILSEGRLLRRAIAADRVGNLLLYGPPGVGKTTLARIIAENTRSNFVILNAVLAGIKELRKEIFEAKQRLNDYGLKTILFIDEVHRFNTAQQDALLPWVENGILTLIGATTENPYFEVNKALVSRSRVFRLRHLQKKDLHKLLKRALSDCDRGFGNKKIEITPEGENHLVDIANGDARKLLNSLELAVETTKPNEKDLITIDLRIAEESIQERAVLYDKDGDAHYDTISAFIKSLRGSDPDGALYWLARMVAAGENPRFLFRRMLISAGEDVGLADPQAIVVVEACAAAFERVGLPEGLYQLAQAALYLSTTEKSNSVKGFFDALKAVNNSASDDVPTHLRDAHRDKDKFGDGKGYLYPHSYVDNWVVQQYMPDAMQGEIFWKPSKHGWEGVRRLKILERRAAQFAATEESKNTFPLFLSSSPNSGELEKWIQRQLFDDGVRLQGLLKHLWTDISWNRTDRVLIFGNKPLFWSIPPLLKTPEGGVVILSDSSEISRISNQLDVLDPLLRPTLLIQDLKFENLLNSKFNYEWIGGRLTNEILSNCITNQFVKVITSKCSFNCRMRLLITTPVFGPLKTCFKSLKSDIMKSIDIKLIEEIITLEDNILMNDSIHEELNKSFKNHGWHLKFEEYEEELLLKLDHNLQKRWFSKDSAYNKLILNNFDDKYKRKLYNLLQLNIDRKIQYKLRHRKIIGQLID